MFFRYKRIFIFTFIFLALFFLANSVNDYFRRSKFYSSEFIRGREIIEMKQLGLPYGIDCIGDKYLVIIDKEPALNRGHVQIFSLDDFLYISSSGYGGLGPGELRSPSYLSTLPQDTQRFSVFDPSLQRLTIYSVFDSFIKFEHFFILKEGMPYAAIAINDTEVISLCYRLTDGRIALYGREGKIKKTFGKILPGWRKGTPILVHQDVSKSCIRASPDGKLYVVAAQYADIIDIYDNDGKFVKRIEGPLRIKPKYETDWVGSNPVMAIDEEKTKWCYLDVAVTNDKIIALFSGEPFKTKDFGGKYLHVYDWNGKFLKAYTLDSKVYKIAIDRNGKRLFGIQLYPNMSIKMFELF